MLSGMKSFYCCQLDIVIEVPGEIGKAPFAGASPAAIETPTALDNHPSMTNRLSRFIAFVTFIQARPQGHLVPRLRAAIH
jgi:hypothetical protein